MEVTLKQLDAGKVRRPWRSMEPLHTNVREIVNNPAKHRQPLLAIADFHLPAERGVAGKTRQNMIRVYGPKPAIAGLTFYVVRHDGNRLESLICYYDPELIEDGEYQKWFERAERKRLDKQANRKKDQ